MDKFESQFEDLDVQTEYMENSMGHTTALTTPQDQVEELMQQVAEENGLEMAMGLPGLFYLILGASKTLGIAKKEAQSNDELGERLAKLRG